MTELAEIAVSHNANATIVSIAGEIDTSNADEVKRALAGLTHTSRGGLIIDLSCLEFIASAGIRALLSLAKRPDAEAGPVGLVVPSNSPIRRVLLIVDVPKAIPLYGSISAAVAAMSEASARSEESATGTAFATLELAQVSESRGG
jgi:anti-sigma B factor antagonist